MSPQLAGRWELGNLGARRQSLDHGMWGTWSIRDRIDDTGNSVEHGIAKINNSVSWKIF